MYKVGKIDVVKYKCITPDITTDEVVITQERIEHIKARHPGDYEVIEPYLELALRYPDFILEDGKHENTGLILKQITENDLRFQIIIKIHTSVDEPQFSNSILSAWKISEDRWKCYINNKKILYKSE